MHYTHSDKHQGDSNSNEWYTKHEKGSKKEEIHTSVVIRIFSFNVSAKRNSHVHWRLEKQLREGERESGENNFTFTREWHSEFGS
jgi:hypothetical protein